MNMFLLDDRNYDQLGKVQITFLFKFADGKVFRVFDKTKGILCL